MTNNELYMKAFLEGLEVKEVQLEGLEYQGVSEWDSVGHMALVSAIEEAFDIMLDTDDIIDFNSYEKGKEILTKNYGIEFQYQFSTSYRDVMGEAICGI